MSHDLCTPVDELRGWTRFAKESGSDFAVICYPDRQEILAEVHDESLSGLGVYLKDLDGLAVGQEVKLGYAGEFCRARVRHIEPLNGGYVVGFDCERAKKETSNKPCSTNPA